MSDSLRGAGCVVALVGLDEGEQGDLGDEALPAEADDGQLWSSGDSCNERLSTSGH
jgi:hypothetical protein